jgi:hypothetical protein
LLDEHRRVAISLLAALRNLSDDIPLELCAELEALTFWAALPACTSLLWKALHPTAVVAAATVGQAMAKHRIDAAQARVFGRIEPKKQRKPTSPEPAQQLAEDAGADASPLIPQGHVIVVRMEETQLKSPRMRELVRKRPPATPIRRFRPRSISAT